MANVLSKPSTKARIGYNGFNLSHRLKFSSTFGELLPVFHDLAKPGDKYSLGYRLLTRTEHLNKPAWLSCSEKIDWFFVPLTQLYQFFPEFYYGIQDVKTTLLPTTDVTRFFPALSPNQLQKANFLSALTTSLDVYNPNLVGTGVRVAELLGFPIPNFQVQSSTDMDRSPHPLFPCAYQKIFMDYYRDTDREPNMPEYYNLDMYADSTGPDGDIGGTEFARFFTLRYHRIKPDLFTHTFVSPLYAEGSSQQIDPVSGNTAGFLNLLTHSLQNWLLPQYSLISGSSQNLDNTTLHPDGNVDNFTPSALSGRVPTSSWNTSSSNFYQGNLTRLLGAVTSPQSLRHTFALEKLLEVTRRAGKHYDAQTLAHFGVEVPTGIAGEVMFLGSSSGRLEVRDVISTSSTTGAALGQQAGKAFGAHTGRTIKFTAPCDGIIMAIYCALPDIDWTQKGFDRLHSYTTRDKWFTEEFDNGGMQPLFRYQVNYQFGGTPNTNDMRLGYQYAWMEQKIKYSRVCGALSRTKQDWTPQQDDMDITLPSFYINPQYYNGRTAGKGVFAIDYQFNFLTDVSSTSDNLYDKDPLMHELDFNVYKSSKMSTFGLPSL